MVRTERILVIGTSEVRVLENLIEQLQRIYDINLFVLCYPGATLLTIGQHLTRFLKSHGAMDQIYIFGLTCSIWKKMPLNSEEKPIQAITWDPVCNLSYVPIQMDAITRIAARYNPAVRVYLVIPIMKDIATFNDTFLKRKGRSDLIPLLEQHPQFKRDFLNIKAREMFGKTVEIQGNNQPWFQKRTFSMKAVFDRYYNRKGQSNPHHKFWMGGSDRLGAEDLCYDGLHYTETTFKEMFAFLSLTNFQQRTQDPRPATNPIPTTTTTTSVIVEEVESVPGPSSIQGRLEYRPSQPAALPSSTPPKRTKGKPKARVFYRSRTFKNSMGLGEQPASTSESPRPRDGVKSQKKRGSPMDGSSNSKTKKSRTTNTLPTTPTASTSKSKVKGLRRFDKRKRMQRQDHVSEGTSNNNKPTTSTSAITPEFTTLTTVHITKLWNSAKERGISREAALKEFNRVFEQVTAMDHQD